MVIHDYPCHHIKLELGVINSISHRGKKFNFLLIRKSKACAVFCENSEHNALIFVESPRFFNKGESVFRLIEMDKKFAHILIYDKAV